MDAVKGLCDRLMRAVIATDAIRHGRADDIALGVSVMLEELKAFLTADRYADERAVTMTGGHDLAWASLVATTVARIVKERAN
jgi:hypothetical protein